MNTSKVVSLLLVLAAAFLLALALLFFFGHKMKNPDKTPESKEQETTDSKVPTPPALPKLKVLNVVTYLPDHSVNELKVHLGESVMFDARSKANAYQFNGVTVSVVAEEVPDYPGYTKYTHTLPTVFSGQFVVFDGSPRVNFFDCPVKKMTAYWWFNTLLFLTFTTEQQGPQVVLNYHHFKSNWAQNTVTWEKLVTHTNAELDPTVLGQKLEELNFRAGNVLALNLDEYLEERRGFYVTELDGLQTTFTLTKGSSSQTGFVKVTHKPVGKPGTQEPRRFRLKKLRVSGTDVAEVSVTNKPVVSVSVFWWYNVPLVAQVELEGGDKEYVSFNVETNRWQKEQVERFRTKLLMLKNKLGDTLTLDLSKKGDNDQTYTTNRVLVRVSPVESSHESFKKYTHRFTSGTPHFVGSYVDHGTLQMGLPVARLNEASVYYHSGVPVLLKLNLATAGSLTTKFKYYTNNGSGLWSLAGTPERKLNTDELLKRLVLEFKKLQLNQNYELECTSKSNYLSKGKLVQVAQTTVNDLQGFSVFRHTPQNVTNFRFEKFTLRGSDVAASVQPVEGAQYAQVYFFQEHPLLLNLHGGSAGQAAQAGTASLVPYDLYFEYDAELGTWSKVAQNLSAEGELKKKLHALLSKLGSLTLDLAEEPGSYRSGPVEVTVTDAVPYGDDPPTSFTKRVHTLSSPYPVTKFKHSHFDLVLGKQDTTHNKLVPANEPLVSKEVLVTKVELYLYKEVPLHFVVHPTHGDALRFSNKFQGTLWTKDEGSRSFNLTDFLVRLRGSLDLLEPYDLCKTPRSQTPVTLELKNLATAGTTSVTVTQSHQANGLTLVKHELPENVSRRFTSLTCNDRLLTVVPPEEHSKVMQYNKGLMPLFLTLKSDPLYFVFSGEGTLTTFTPPPEKEFTPQELTKKVEELSNEVGKVFDLDLAKKENYLLQEVQFKVEANLVDQFKQYRHTLPGPGEGVVLPFTLRVLKEGQRDAVVFDTGLKVDWVAVYLKGEDLFYLQVKSNGERGKYYHYVKDGTSWLKDGVYSEFDEEEVAERLNYLKEGLGNETTLDLGEEVDNPLFKSDSVDFDLVKGYVKHTYKPVGLEYPLLLKTLRVGGVDLNLPMPEKHLKLFTAYSYRKNFLFFHALSYNNKDYFFKTNFQGGFTQEQYSTYNEQVLKTQLLELKKPLSDQLSLDLTKKVSYYYHGQKVEVVKQTQTELEGYEKYLHDLVDGDTSVPFKLVSAEDNGFVTNVPPVNQLVYFAYVYMSEGKPLLLELHLSRKESTEYHYLYFTNNLGNWNLVDNQDLRELGKVKLKELLDKSKNKLAKTYKVDLSRKFPYKFTNGANDHFLLNVGVEEDPRETVGFTMYAHTFYLLKQTGAPEDAKPPTAENLEGTTVTPAQANASAAERASAPGASTTTSATNQPAQRTASPSSPAGGAVPAVAAAPAPAGARAEAAAAPEAATEDPSAAFLRTYQTLEADSRRSVNLLSPSSPVAGKFTLGGEELSGFGVDTVSRLNVYWWHDEQPVFVHVLNGVNQKYYRKTGDKWVLVRKSETPLLRSGLGELLKETAASLSKPVELDLDKSSDYDQYVKYVSEGLTLRVVPSYSWEEGYKGFTHFSATNYTRAFKVDRLSLWGEVVVTNLPEGYVNAATVFTDPQLLPLAVELEWTKLNNASSLKKYKYYRNNGHNGWAEHPRADPVERLVDQELLNFLKTTKQALGETVELSLEKRETYAVSKAQGAPSVTVTNEPADKTGQWNGYHKVTHTFTTPSARVYLLKMGERVVRTFHTPTYVKAVDTYWYKNVLLLVKLTVAGASVTTQNTTVEGQETHLYFKNDYKDDLMPFEPTPSTALNVASPAGVLEGLAEPYKDHYQLDLGERTLKNAVDFVKLLPALYVVDAGVPKGFARYNLYVLDKLDGYRLGKLLYHGKDVSTGTLRLPALNVHSVYAFTPVGHFSPFFLELQARGPTHALFYYYHLNQYGNWVSLETGERKLTAEELNDKLSLLTAKLGSVTVVDVSKTEGSYFGLNKVNVTKFEFPGSRGYAKYVHTPHDGLPFTVSKFVNKGVVLPNLPVLKANYVSVYTTNDTKPLLLELKVGGKYKFFSSNANGLWYEERLPSGDLKSTLDRVFDEHLDVARNTQESLSLQLNADFMREYVLTEGKVGDFDGAVAVPSEEPTPERAPQSPRLLPEDTEDLEAETAPAQQLPTVQGATRTTEAPEATLKTSHVLNPLLYVEPDKLAYSYVSQGKTVHVTRRDDVYRGYNVTVHKLPDNKPFKLRRVGVFGRDFDLGLGENKLLSATLYSFQHKPLLLNLVQLDGVEKNYSFNYPTQLWSSVQVDDLEEQLDQYNFTQNQHLVLDLGKEEAYTVNRKELSVEKATFGNYVRKVTKSKDAVNEKAAVLKKRQKKLKKREETKRLLKTELDNAKEQLKVLMELVNEKKKEFENLLEEWVKVASDKANKYKQVLEAEKALDALKKEVAQLEKEYQASQDAEKKKVLDAKKATLTTKEAEYSKLVAAESQGSEPAAPAASQRPASGSAPQAQEGRTETQTQSGEGQPTRQEGQGESQRAEAPAATESDPSRTLKTKLTECVEAAKEVKGLNLTSSSGTSPAFELAKVTKAEDVATKLSLAVVSLEKLKDEVTSAEDVKSAKTVLDSVKTLVNESTALAELFTHAKKVTEATSQATTLENNYKTVAETFKSAVDGVTLQEVSGGDSNNYETQKEAVKKLKDAATAAAKLKELVEPLKNLKKLVDGSPRVRGVALLNDALKRLALETVNVDEVVKSVDKVEQLFNKLKELNSAAKLVKEANLESANEKLTAFLTKFDLLNEELTPQSTKDLEAARAHLEKLKVAEDAVAKVAKAQEVATKLVEKVKALKSAEDFATEELTDGTDKEKAKKLVEAANALKEAYADVEKLKEAFEAAKKVKSDVDTGTKLNQGYEKAKALDSNLTTYKSAETTNASSTEEEKFKALAKAAKTLKAAVPDSSTFEETVKPDVSVKPVKDSLNTEYEALKAKSAGLFELGVKGAKVKYQAMLFEVPEVEEHVKKVEHAHDAYRVDDPRAFDPDELGTSDPSVLVGLGGLRYKGKELPVAGLPLGTHVHTLNAYFTEGWEGPLVLQFKYSESDDVDEPVVQSTRTLPSADELQLADRATQQVSPAQAGVTPAVQTVQTLLSQNLGNASSSSAPESGSVVTSTTGSTGTSNTGPSAPPEQAQQPANAAGTPAAPKPAEAPSRPVETSAVSVQPQVAPTESQGQPQVQAAASGQTASGSQAPGNNQQPAAGVTAPGNVQTPTTTAGNPVTAAQPATSTGTPVTTTPPTTTTTAVTTVTTTQAVPGVASTPAPQAQAPAREKVYYPGRFFVWDGEGVWKAFVPELKGALTEKLDELKEKLTKKVGLDVGRETGGRRKGSYMLKEQEFTVKRVLYSSGYKLTREGLPANLQGSGQQPAQVPNSFDLNDFDRSVQFFPPFNYKWYTHYRPAKLGEQNKVVDQLPSFVLEKLMVNEKELELEDELKEEVFTTVKSVSAVVTESGKPLVLFVYKPNQLESALVHHYYAMVLKGKKYVKDVELSNYQNLLYKLEHTNFEWGTDHSFNDFSQLLRQKLELAERESGPSYEVDLGAQTHYQHNGLVVNVEKKESLGVKHVEYTPGFLLTEGQQTPTLVPEFVLEKVFWGDEEFKGFNLPATNVLHVAAFHGKHSYMLKENTRAEFTHFPVLVEVSYRNKFNRLENYYYQYVGGNEFELLTKTKNRFTAGEVADAVAMVLQRRLREAKFGPLRLDLDFAVKSTHYKLGHKVLVEKQVKTTARPTTTPGTQPQVTNAHVPEGYALYMYKVPETDPGYTEVNLHFKDYWTYKPDGRVHQDYYAYVKLGDKNPVLLALGYTDSNKKKYDWVGVKNNRTEVVFTGEEVDPTAESSKTKVEEQLKALTANVDFWSQRKEQVYKPVPAGTKVKLAPVGGVGGFPVVPTRQSQPSPPLTVTA